ncbi:hypothetical protein Bca101_088138 [Brassica carinata]
MTVRVFEELMVELGASTKLAKTRLGVIERLRAESKKVSEKTLEEKEILKVKFEDLEAKLVADRAAKRELEKAKVVLEKENARLRAERNAAVEKLAEERKRLRDSRSLEVTRERVRVQSAMTEKFGRCIGRVRDYLARRVESEKEQNLSGQASGTRKCLEMIRNEGLGITQELIDVFIEQERVHNAAVAKLAVGDLPEEDLVLSPLVLPNPFLNEEFIAALDPYGSNDGLVGSETASLLRESSDIPEGGSTGQSSEVRHRHSSAMLLILISRARSLRRTMGWRSAPTMEREELEPTAERSASDVIPNEVPKDAAADGAQDPSVSGEALA